MSQQMLSFIDERRRREEEQHSREQQQQQQQQKESEREAWEEVPAERASKRERESLEREKERERFFNGESTFVLPKQKGAKYERDKMPKHQTERQTTDMTENRIKEEEKEGFQ